MGLEVATDGLAVATEPSSQLVNRCPSLVVSDHALYRDLVESGLPLTECCDRSVLLGSAGFRGTQSQPGSSDLFDQC